MTVFGVGLSCLGFVGFTQEWPLASPLVPIVFGILFLACGVTGAVANVNWREGSILWPDPKVYDRLAAVEQELAVERAARETMVKRLASETADLDYVYSLLPAPDDEDFDSPQERLQQWEETEMQLGSEISMRQFTGEDYDDGISLQDLQKMRAELDESITREGRRLRARAAHGRG